MADPTEKSEALTNFLETNFGRTSSINNNVCIPKPMGCGGPATEFTDPQSEHEYRISGMCQKCQDAFYGGVPEDCGLNNGTTCSGCEVHPTIAEIVGWNGYGFDL